MMRKKRHKSFFEYLSVIFIITFILSCNEESTQKKGYVETINSGKLTVLCEDGIYDLMKPAAAKYDSAYPKVKLIFNKTTARDAMAQLLAGKARVILISRGYMKDEDSLMKAYNVEPYLQLTLCEDALVFYVRNDFPLDTINSTQIKEFLTKENVKLSQFFPVLKTEPKLICNSHLSSEYEQLREQAADGKPIVEQIILMPDYDSVMKYIYRDSNAIGIGLLSQVVKDKGLRPLLIGFYDSTGKYINPKPVH